MRPGERRDLSQVTALYDHYILESAITFDTEPWTVEEREHWFARFGPSGRYRFFVATEDDDATLLGYATSSPYRPKKAYETSIETSIYLVPDAAGRGLGAALYTTLFDALVDEDVHRAYAGITEGNPASDALHRRFGFRPYGTATETGRKLGRFWDVTWWQKDL